jgi:Domain of unknown function (DUF5615)
MSWKTLSDPTVDDVSAVRRARHARLYADEDVEEEVVELLRAAGVNITSARELDHRGKPDNWQAEHARTKGRFLLTKNGRDFLNDTKYPWHRGYSILVLEGDMANTPDLHAALRHIVHIIVPTGEFSEGSKIVVGPRQITTRFREEGRIVTRRFRLEGRDMEIWEDDD